MRNITCCIFILILSTIHLFAQKPQLSNFVLIKGNTFNSGDVVTNTNRPLVRVDDFEMLDHQVTNAEYKQFTDATGFTVPLHWTNGEIPKDKEDYPVIYVNRYDVDEYMKWFSNNDGKVYRLPSTVEFEYASRGGFVDKVYPWGDDIGKSKANFDSNESRKFNQWQNYLQPARSNKPNGYGLYNMAGNTWHLTINLLDPAVTPYKYQILNIPLLEGSRMGGSWARSKEYLRCGNQSEFSAGIRHPDAGFRPIRQPEGVDWHIQNRKLCAVSTGNGNVFLSWALLQSDSQNTRFNVYRSDSRNHSGFLINKEPISGSTTFSEQNLKIGKRYHFYVKTVDPNGKEGRRSEWTGITIAEENSTTVVKFKPICKLEGEVAPVFGDLNGDGSLDCVARLYNGNHEESQNPGLPVQIKAFSSYGRSMWRKDISYHEQCYESGCNVVFNVWDMDDDGKAEVITRLQVGDSVYVAILDGITGEVKNKTLWPEMATDDQRSSTRIQMSVAYLDGVHPAVITQTGLYENEVLVAFDADLNELWQFDSFAETNGSGAHTIEVADVDFDGKQEVFDGTTCLNHDGTIRWSIYRQHPNKVCIHDFLPDRPGLEVYYVVESNAHAGVYMVDANSGEVIWKENRADDPRWIHGHIGWAADIWEGSPGIECLASHNGWKPDIILFSSEGKKLVEPFPYYKPVEWDGSPVRELLINNGHSIGKFDGEKVQVIPNLEPNNIPNSTLLMTADLYGDFREELVVQKNVENGLPEIVVITSVDPINKRYITPTENLDYRLWLARNKGGGYGGIYYQKLKVPSK